MNEKRYLNNNIIERYVDSRQAVDLKHEKKIHPKKLFNTFKDESNITRVLKDKLFDLFKLEENYENFNIIQCFINKFFYNMTLNENIIGKINLLVSDNPELINFVIV